MNKDPVDTPLVTPNSQRLKKLPYMSLLHCCTLFFYVEGFKIAQKKQN